MEERKLNFNLPLLSVRRSSSLTGSSSPTISSASVKFINGDKEKKNVNFQVDSLHTITSYKQAYNLDQVTEPVAVPFLWEQIPGRPKGETLRDLQLDGRIPRRRESDKKSEDEGTEAKSLNKIASGFGCLKERETQKSIVEFENEEDNDDVCSDGLGPLSSSDLFSLNCSVSGFSGFDNKFLKPSGTCSTDPQTRDFMMNRFLPAAMAMTLDPPQHVPRKQPVSGEQSREIANVVHKERTRPDIPPYHQDEEESGNACDEFSDYGNITAKRGGFLPRLCVKNSLCLLYPVPGIKVRAQTSLSSDRNKLSKADFSRSQPSDVKKPVRGAVSKQNRDNEGPSPRLLGFENKPSGGSNRHLISRTSSIQRSGFSSPRYEEAPQSSFDGRRLQPIPKELGNARAPKLNKFNGSYSKSQELIPSNSMRRARSTTERTVLVDTVNVAGLLRSSSCSLNNNKSFMDTVEEDVRPLYPEIALVKSSFKDVKCLDSETSPEKGQAEMIEDLSKASKGSECNVDIGSDRVPNRDNSESDNARLVPVQPPLPPFSPKKPSESWLSRTLPSVSSQSRSSVLYRQASFRRKMLDLKALATTSKWENIVKSSYSHHDHVRYSEELFPHAPQQPTS